MKKKTVAATNAIEISQNETPTKSLDFNTVPEVANGKWLFNNPPNEVTEKVVAVATVGNNEADAAAKKQPTRTSRLLD
jgi:hypothetical protein